MTLTTTPILTPSLMKTSLKKSQCRYISALFAIQTLKSFKNSKQPRTKVWLIIFHSGAVNQKILFHSPRKFQEIPMGIFGQMKSALCYLWQTKNLPSFLRVSSYFSTVATQSFLQESPWVTNLTLDMAKPQTCWSSAIIYFKGKNDSWQTLCLLNQRFSINCLLLNIKTRK